MLAPSWVVTCSRTRKPRNPSAPASNHSPPPDRMIPLRRSPSTTPSVTSKIIRWPNGPGPTSTGARICPRKVNSWTSSGAFPLGPMGGTLHRERDPEQVLQLGGQPLRGELAGGDVADLPARRGMQKYARHATLKLVP